jgi:hypothetical protein
MKLITDTTQTRAIELLAKMLQDSNECPTCHTTKRFAHRNTCDLANTMVNLIEAQDFPLPLE